MPAEEMAVEQGTVLILPISRGGAQECTAAIERYLFVFFVFFVVQHIPVHMCSTTGRFSFSTTKYTKKHRTALATRFFKSQKARTLFPASTHLQPT